MKTETSKSIEQTINEMVTLMYSLLLLAAIAEALGFDISWSKVQSEAYNQLVSVFETIMDEVIKEIKSVDGYEEILEVWQLASEFGMFFQNVQTWLTSIDESIQSLEDIKTFIEDIQGFIKEFHALLERADELNSDEHTEESEPNDPKDE